MSLGDEDARLIRMAAVSPTDPSRPPRSTDALPHGVTTQEIWDAMARAGAAAHPDFPGRDDMVTAESLERLSRVARSLLAMWGLLPCEAVARPLGVQRAAAMSVAAQEKRTDSVIFVLHGGEPGTIRGVYATLELAKAATAATDWYQHADGGEWTPGPGPAAQLSITAHAVLS